MAEYTATKQELVARERVFEKELEEAEESGDALATWTVYLTWMEEKKLVKHDCYRQALKKCIAYFTKLPLYNSDLRLVNIYIKLANVYGDPVMLYKHMLSQEVGTQYSVLYDAYATALEKGGNREEALRVLELGVARKTHPVKRLQKKLEAMKQQLLPEPNEVPVANKQQLGDQAERNDEFYVKPKIVFMYPKELVYLRDGSQLQLEQVRAGLPQYHPLFTEDSAGESDMEMTEAYIGNITTFVPVLPGLFPHSGIGGKQAGVIKSEEDKENQDSRVLKSSSARKPLQLIEVREEGQSVEEELEKLCEDKPFTVPLRGSHHTGTTSRLSNDVDDVDKQLEQLVLERPSQRVILQKDMDALRNQENVVPPPRKEEFDFTPNTVDGGINWPRRGAWNGSGFVTQLSFSEADSLSGSHHAHSLAEESGSGRLPETGGMFNTTLECEKRVRLTREQLKFENEFANTSVQNDPSYSEVGSSWQQSHNNSSQSFEVFHDSWMNQSSQQHSLRQKTSAFRRVCQPEEKRRPLQEVASKPLHSSQNPSSEIPYDNSQSFLPSQSNVSSFSVYEDSQESSLAPFHDSWISNSRNASRSSSNLPHTSYQKAPHSSFQNASHTNTSHASFQNAPHASLQNDSHASFQNASHASLQNASHASLQNAPHASFQNVPFQRRGDSMQPPLTYRAPLGIPLMTHREGSPTANHTEQSFTQFDIKHPCGFDPSSTPRGERIDLTFDLSVIPGAGEVNRLEEKPCDKGAPVSRPEPCQSLMYGNLSTIIEESGSYKSSSTSSASSNSTVPHDSLGQSKGEVGTEDVNPFLPQFVNFMLNSVGYPVHKMEEVNSQLPKLVSGRRVTLGEDQFTSLNKVADGGCATIYSATLDSQRLILKVQSPPLEWEVAVVEKLHQRIQAGIRSPSTSSCFMEIEKAYRYDNATVIVSPYLIFGSLLDVANASRMSRSQADEMMVFYITRELLALTATLHECGIIHTDIKPDNLLLRDLRQCENFSQAKGKGVCLIDFGRAIDTRAFPDEMMFVGSCETEGFQCLQMLEGKPWKWQVDYFGIAATVYVLMQGQYMTIKQNPTNGLYRPQKSPPRMFDSTLWMGMFETLLNVQEPLSLTELIKPIDAKLKSFPDFMFRGMLQKSQGLLTNYFKQRQ